MYQTERGTCNFSYSRWIVKLAPNYSPMSEFSEQVDRPAFEQKLMAGFAIAKWQDVRVVVTVSGGADSVSLLCALLAIRNKQAAGDVHVLHVNHRWRAEQSDADQQFVEDLCAQFEVPCHAVVLELSEKTEETARLERYKVFLEQARQLGARYVLTAHTRDDQVETLIDRVFRGTGLSGLKGIPRTRELDHGISLLRPLLGHSREEVLSYLEQLGQEYCEDSTNQSLDFTRNRIRHELLPLLKENYHAEADRAVLRLSEMALELSEYLSTEAAVVAERVVMESASDLLVLNCNSFVNVASIVVREVLIKLWVGAGWPRQSMTRGHWLQLESLLVGEQSVVMFPGEIRAEKNGEQLSLTRR